MSEPQHPPVPPYAQPSGQPQPHAQGYPGQQPSYGPPPRTTAGSSLGRVALIVALVSVALGLLQSLAFPFLVRTLDYSYAIGAVASVWNGLVLVVAVVALILGIMAVRRPGQQVLAGVAIGIAATEIIGILVSYISNAFYAFV